MFFPAIRPELITERRRQAGRDLYGIAVTVHAHGVKAACVEAGNHFVVGVEHFRAFVDLYTALCPQEDGARAFTRVELGPHQRAEIRESLTRTSRHVSSGTEAVVLVYGGLEDRLGSMPAKRANSSTEAAEKISVVPATRAASSSRRTVRGL